MSADTDQDRRRFLGTAATTIAAARLGVLGAAFQQIACGAHPQVAGRELSAVLDATSWLEAPAPTPDAVRGRVVLVDFCTYTCINWLRQLPYLRAWDARYRDHGLVVIGVHTPEFTFERDRDNVRRAVTGSRIEYPVVVDNDFAIWHAFRNNYWPAIYLIDAQGRVRHRQFGEGEYDRTERSVRRLLAEARDGSAGPEIAAVNARGVEAPADWGSLKSSETYMGYERTERLASPGGAAADEARAYVAPQRLTLNDWALAGDWTVGREAAVLNRGGGRIAYRFHARDLHLVMGPASRGSSVRFHVRLDGEPPGAARGLDVDDTGAGTATEPRMYQLVRQPGTIADRTFEIEFLDRGAAAYAFTFG